MLAGVPNAPSVYAPTVNFKLASERQMQVLNKMVEYGYITDDKKNEILSMTCFYLTTYSRNCGKFQRNSLLFFESDDRIVWYVVLAHP